MFSIKFHRTSIQTHTHTTVKRQAEVQQPHTSTWEALRKQTNTRTRTHARTHARAKPKSRQKLQQPNDIKGVTHTSHTPHTPQYTHRQRGQEAGNEVSTATRYNMREAVTKEFG